MDNLRRERARSQPAKGKGKGKGKGKTPQKGNHNQNQIGSLDEETGQHTLSDFGLKRQRVQLVGDVQGHDDGFKAAREDQANCVFCVHSCENVMSEYLDVPSTSGISGVRVIEEPANIHELKFDSTTGEEVFLAVGCRDDRPIVDSGSVVSTCPVDYSMSVPTEKVHSNMNLESVLGGIITTLWCQAQCFFRQQKKVAP